MTGPSIFDRYKACKSQRELTDVTRDFGASESAFLSGMPRIKLAVAGNYSTQFLIKSFPLALGACGVAVECYESSYNQWQLELLDKNSSLYAFKPTHILVALTSIEFAFTSKTPENVGGEIIGAINAAISNSEAHIFLTLPEPLSDEGSDDAPAYRWRQVVLQKLKETIVSPRVTFIDIEPLIRKIGFAHWYDERFYDVAKLPFHPDATPRLLQYLSNAIAGIVRTGCKLVIVDLDDTLWGGRVGDDGWEGINLDSAGQGRHFLRMQAFLKGLLDKGVVLALASKNNVDVVAEAFEKRPELLLRLEDFSASEIHWEPKSVSVSRILKQLNLTTNGVVFLDDNPLERAEVRARFPEVFVPELPENPAERLESLISTGVFDRRVVTAESNARSRMYKENRERDLAYNQSGNITEFLAGLDMVLESLPIEAARERVLELIQKTNQFNLTGRRYNWDDLLRSAEGGFARCYRLKDKFGDNGIISIASVSGEGGSGTIKLWVMSCRVFGRKVENAILSDIISRCRALGLTKLIGEFIPTKKNAFAADLYPRLGFRSLRSDPALSTYSYPIDETNAAKTVEFIRQVEVAA